MIKDYFVFAMKTFTHRKIRSLLTMVGIFIGIAAVVSLISLGQGLQSAITTQFSTLGTDKIIIQALSPFFGPPGQLAVEDITERDLEEIKRTSGVEVAAGRVLGSVKVEFDDKVNILFGASIPLKDEDEKRLIEETLTLKASDGRLLKKGDNFKVVIGNNLAEDNIFQRDIKVGDKLIINDENFEVVGILSKSGFPPVDNALLIPQDRLKKLLGFDDELSAIVAKAKTENINQVADNIARNLRDLRNVDEGKEDFEVETPEHILQGFNTIFSIVQAVLIGIAGISLFVGGIGIMNTMYTSVLERTNEIGVMKAIGARNGHILLIFLIESGTLGLIGGIVGVIIGIILAKSVEIGSTLVFGTSLIQAEISLFLIIGSLVFSVLVGVIAGTFPAMQASKLKPVDALRYE